jgi:hypothetical protein
MGHAPGSGRSWSATTRTASCGSAGKVGIGFGEWTPDGKLRHPRYIGLRDDKRPKQVVREQA